MARHKLPTILDFHPRAKSRVRYITVASDDADLVCDDQDVRRRTLNKPDDDADAGANGSGLANDAGADEGGEYDAGADALLVADDQWCLDPTHGGGDDEGDAREVVAGVDVALNDAVHVVASANDDDAAAGDDDDDGGYGGAHVDHADGCY